MDLIFDITQRPADYVGDVISVLGEDGLNAGEASFLFDDGGTVINGNSVGN